MVDTYNYPALQARNNEARKRQDDDNRARAKSWNRQNWQPQYYENRRNEGNFSDGIAGVLFMIFLLWVFFDIFTPTVYNLGKK